MRSRVIMTAGRTVAGLSAVLLLTAGKLTAIEYEMIGNTTADAA